MPIQVCMSERALEIENPGKPKSRLLGFQIIAFFSQIRAPPPVATANSDVVVEKILAAN